MRPDWFERLVAVIPQAQEQAQGQAQDLPFRQFVPPADGSALRSAVLVLFGPGAQRPGTQDQGPEVLLTERSHRMRSHAGQVAFPGGRVDPGDAGPESAALREAVEETGLDPSGVQIAGTGPDLYVSVTNFLVTPVIAWWERPSAVRPGDPAEVHRVVPVPLAQLVDPANRFMAAHPSGFRAPGFEVQGLFVWGFTAGVLNWLLRLAGLERPWDTGRVVPVPDRLLGGRTLAAELSEQLADPPAEHLVERLTDQRVAE